MKYCYLMSALLMLGVAPAAQSQGHRQSGFVVKTNGDTIRGEFRGNMLRHGSREVVLYSNGVPASFTAAEASACGTGTLPIVVSRPLGRRGPQTFLRPLAFGYVSLYAGNDTKGNSRFYLQPTDSAYAIEVAPLSAQLTFNRLLSGCAAFQFGTDKMQRTYPYSYEGMLRLVQAYNACRRPNEPTRLVSPAGTWRVALGVKAGAHRTGFSEYDEGVLDGTTSQGNGFQIGGAMHIQNHSLFSLQLEAMLMTMQNTSKAVPVYTGTALFTETGRVKIQFLELNVPVLLRYSIGRGPVQPYLNAGPCVGANFNNKSAIVYEFSNSRPTETVPLLRPDGLSVGYAAGAGVLVAPAKGPAFSIEARLDHLIDRMDNSVYSPRHNTLRLDVGLFFN